MDSIDIAILWDLGFDRQIPNRLGDRRPAVTKIATELGLDRRTVRSRIRKLESEGFIKYYQVYPNLEAAGLRASSYLLQFQDYVAKSKALGKLESLDQVLRIDVCLNSLRITLTYISQEQLEALLYSIGSLTGSHPVKLYDFQMPQVSTKLELTDWRIIASLRRDALKTPAKIGKELGLTARAVNYRLNRLISARAYLVAPVFDMREFAGTIIYGLMLEMDHSTLEATVNSLKEAFGRASFCHIVNPNGNAMFMMFTDKIAEVEENYFKAREMLGVNRVFVDIITGTRDCSRQMDQLITKEIREIQGTRK